MKTIAVDLPERLTEELDGLIKEGWFLDESEIVRMALSPTLVHFCTLPKLTS